MKEETTKIINEVNTMMRNNGLEAYTIEILLQSEIDDSVAAFTACLDQNNYDEKPIYIGHLEDIEKINSNDPCTWLASLLELGYSILYCSLSFHCLIWIIYYDYFESFDIYENGLNEYLRYCKQHHITLDLLEGYCGRDFEDLPAMEFNEVINQHTVIDRFTINEQAFLFAVNESDGTFGVYDSNADYSYYKNEQIYATYLEAFQEFQDRIKKCWYDGMRAFHEEFFLVYGGDKEVDSIINNGRNE